MEDLKVGDFVYIIYENKILHKDIVAINKLTNSNGDFYTFTFYIEKRDGTYIEGNTNEVYLTKEDIIKDL